MMENLFVDEVLQEAPAKILVVDDREDNLLSIETILENGNYEIVKALSGKAALKILLSQQDFTLILMDVQMPDMSGFETANLIYQREKLKHIPIIFITAHNHDDENVFEGYKLGAVDYIYKPINPDLLRFKVGVFAEMYQKNYQLRMQERSLMRMNAYLEREVEERKSSEEKVQLLNQQLLANNANLKATIEELDRFAYVASHDLQEPLRKIMVFSDKLMQANQGRFSDDMQRYVEKIVKSSERMQKLINDLLIFSRPADSFGGFVEIDLEELIEGVLSDMEIAIENCGAKVKIDVLPKVWGIPSQLRQVFQNLLSNAIKFRREATPPFVSIYCDFSKATLDEARKDDHCRIIIQDNGIGFDEKYVDEIFVVFKRLHSYHEYEGTGVGLSICKKIIDRHHGRIFAQSKLNEGSRFVIELPLKSYSASKLTSRLNELTLGE